MKAIEPKEWIFSGDMHFEESAKNVITDPGNTLVVAGPGAGKTELLAQKAFYLLQTNLCRFPRKILAISFKRDAAYNLKERVRKRAGDSHCRRFESYTFDAFAKLILDRFSKGLPVPYQINKDYRIFFGEETIKDRFKGVDLTYYSTHAIRNYDTWLTSQPLPLKINTREDEIRSDIWIDLLSGNQTLLTFKMLMRLATLIMDNNPQLRSFLQQTYSHVFLDEFQDTTDRQYTFLKACFVGSDVKYTAVGDDKQRIMGWAGAIPEIFELYAKETSAKKFTLKMNFRSAPKLVSLQNHLVKELLNKTDFAIPSEKWKKDEGEAILHFFNTPAEEKESILRYVKQLLDNEHVDPREICILVKQRLPVYTVDIIQHLRSNGIRARNEEAYQDTLKEEAIVYVSAVIHYIFDKTAVKIKKIVFDIIASLNPGYNDDHLIKIHKRIAEFKKQTICKFAKGFDKAAINDLIMDIFNFGGLDRFRCFYHQYKQGEFLNETISKFTKLLQDEFEVEKDIIKSLDMVEGKNFIPVMTIHKSKGLEYHSVVFVGLENRAFWSYAAQPDEDKNAFFVALSRAKEKVLFTFCKVRNVNGYAELQSFDKINDIFDKLTTSNLVDIKRLTADHNK